MLYWLVGSRELDGGLMCTASHNPKAYTGAKLVREGALALSGDEGIQDIRQLIEEGIPASPAAGSGSVEQVDLYAPFHETALALVDTSAIKPLKVVVDGGNGMAGPMVGPLLEQLGPRPRDRLLDARRQLPRPRAEPAAAGEPRVHHGARSSTRAPTSGSRGTATPTAASSSTTRARSSTATSSPRCSPRRCWRSSPARRSSTTCAPRRAVRDTVEARRRHRAREPRRPRVLQDAHARDGRVVRRRGLRPLLLPPVLQRGLRHAAGAADPRAAVAARREAERAARRRCARRYFISGEINSEVADQQAKLAEIEARYGDAEIDHLDGVSVDYDDWHFNVRPSNTEPLLRLCLESLVSHAGHGAAARRGARADPRLTRVRRRRGRARRRPRSPRRRTPASTASRSRRRSSSGASTAT